MRLVKTVQHDENLAWDEEDDEQNIEQAVNNNNNNTIESLTRQIDLLKQIKEAATVADEQASGNKKQLAIAELVDFYQAQFKELSSQITEMKQAMQACTSKLPESVAFFGKFLQASSTTTATKPVNTASTSVEQHEEVQPPPAAQETNNAAAGNAGADEDSWE